MEIAVSVPVKAASARAPAEKTLSKSRKKKDFLAALLAAQTGPGGGVSQERHDHSFPRETENLSELKAGEKASLPAAHREESPVKEATSLLSLFPGEGCHKTCAGNVLLNDGTGMETEVTALKKPENNSGMAMVSSFAAARESGSEENTGGKRFLPVEAFAAAEITGLERPPGKVPRGELIVSELPGQSFLTPGRSSPPETETSLLTVGDEGAEPSITKEEFFLCPAMEGKETKAVGENAFSRGKTEQSFPGREDRVLAEEDGYTLLPSGFKASPPSAGGEVRDFNIKEVVFKPLMTAMRPQKDGVPGDGEIRVSLKPDFLGQVSIRLSRQGGLMKGMIIVETALVREAIESHLPEFKQRLAEQNLHMEELTVFLKDPGEGRGGSGYSNLQQDCLYRYPGPGELPRADMEPREWEPSQGALNILV